MNFQRAWNTYTPAVVRRNPYVTWGIAIFIFILLIWSFRGSTLEKVSPSHFCESEINLYSELLNSSNVHVVPSTPMKRGIYNTLRNVDAVEVEGENLFQNDCVEMLAPGGMLSLVICIHDPKQDLMVSAHLQTEGAWEREHVQAMYDAHRMFPNMVLVDLGCNLGVFTLPAAKMGMEVIAVDAMMASLKLLQRSLLMNDLSCHVTLIHNALYRRRRQMRVVVDPTNIGGSSVAEIMDFHKDKIPPSHLVDAICLNDLVPLVKGKDVFLKVDLEGSEHLVFECAKSFFEEVNVKVLLIEWMYHRHNEKNSAFLKDFLLNHNMVPTWGVDRDRHIDIYASHSWPDNVFWMQK